MSSVERLAKKLGSKKSESVRVVVRVRPLSSKEKQDGRELAVEVDRKSCQIVLSEPGGTNPKSFTFDNVYGPGTLQKTLLLVFEFFLVVPGE